MIQVAVCEDNQKDLKNLTQLITRYNDSIDEPTFEVSSFKCPTDLLCNLNDGVLASVFILDIMMPETDGIELGKKIRQCISDAIIIYTTSHKEYALDAFGVLAQRYLVKPFQEEEFFEALSFAHNYVTSKQVKIFSVKTSRALVGVPHKEILYVEYVSRVLHVHCLDGNTHKSVFLRQSFEHEIESLLAGSSFVQTHKSYAINMEYVGQLKNHVIIMSNGFSVPVARKRQAEVKRVYLGFLAGFGA